MSTRNSARAGIPDTGRITLLENDVDNVEEAMDHLAEELKSQTKILTGILVAIATASILLAINIGVRGFSG